MEGTLDRVELTLVKDFKLMRERFISVEPQGLKGQETVLSKPQLLVPASHLQRCKHLPWQSERKRLRMLTILARIKPSSSITMVTKARATTNM